jgi:hypothetical protein
MKNFSTQVLSCATKNSQCVWVFLVRLDTPHLYTVHHRLIRNGGNGISETLIRPSSSRVHTAITHLCQPKDWWTNRKRDLKNVWDSTAQ